MGAALKAAGDNSAGSLEGMKDLASQLQRTTIYSRDMATSAEGLLISIGHLSAEGVQEILPHVADLAQALGINLDHAGRMVAQSLDGTRNMLSRYGIEVDKSADSSTKLKEVIDGLQAKFGGIATAVGGDAVASMTKLQNANKALSQQMGESFARSAQPIIDFLTKLKLAWADELKSENEYLVSHAKVLAGTASGQDIINENMHAIALLQEQMKQLTSSASLYVDENGKLTKGYNDSLKSINDQIVALEKHNLQLSNASVYAAQYAAEVARQTQSVLDSQKKAEEAWKGQAEAMKTATEALKEHGQANANWTDVIISRLRLMHDATQGVDEISNKTWADVANGANVASKSVMDASLKYALSIKSTLLGVEKDYDEGAKAAQKAAEESFKAFEKSFRQIEGVVHTVMGQLSSISSTYYQGQNNALDAWYQKQIASLGDMTNATKAQTDAKAAIDKEYAEKQSALKKQQWETDRSMALANAFVSTAEAVVKTFSEFGWPWGVIPAAIVAALGSVQIGLIAGEPEPAFAQGGSFTVPPGYPNDSFPMRVQSGEHVSVTPAGQGGDQVIHNTLVLDGQVLADWTTRASRNGRILTRARSVVP